VSGKLAQIYKRSDFMSIEKVGWPARLLFPSSPNDARNSDGKGGLHCTHRSSLDPMICA
jgi:hypothetical protein